MDKIFISLPMHGFTKEEYKRKRFDAIFKITEILKENGKDIRDYELLDTYDAPDAPEDAGRLWYLGRSIQILGTASMVYFGEGWLHAKGCRMEHRIAEEYEIPILGEDLSHI